MPSIIVNNNSIVLFANDVLTSFSTVDKCTQKIEILQNPDITTICFSQNYQQLAFCTQNKQLLLYKVDDFTLIKSWEVKRSVSKVRFTSSGDLLIADKTGDVYLFSLNTNEGKHIVGHLSMLLDVAMSPCNNYIATCDRDEKIRVSNFPDTYNICMYCLGHTEYVGNVEFYDSNTLISSSGDGTIRFWDFRTGKQLHCIETNAHLSDERLLEIFAKAMDAETIDVQSLPITNMNIQQFGTATLLFVSLFSCNQLLVFEILNPNETKLLQTIDVNSNLLSFDVLNNLYVLTTTGINVYEFKDNTFLIVPNSVELNEFYHSFRKNINEQILENENVSVLFKRKYDNVHEYQEKKKLRLSKQNKLQ